ncbi:LacI family DNA-binding transcriptional regulator [Frateuria aurantia]
MNPSRTHQGTMMARRFLVKEIALQAGVGVATVDRVLNGREHVRERTRQRVLHAIDELEGQQFQLAAQGRRLVLDVVMEAPHRFSHPVRSALEAELPSLYPAVFRPRFSLRETMTDHEMLAALQAIARRGSHGVLLKARDFPALRRAVVELQEAGIPVITLFTDLPGTSRLAYAGVDNRVAGATAAWLMAQSLSQARGSVLVTLSDPHFRGEEARLDSFRSMLQRRCPQLHLIEASGGHGLDLATEARVHKAVGRRARVVAVYSMGGGNTAILRALDGMDQFPSVFVGHDLDHDNLRLLREERISAILHHDLRQDLRAACQHLMAYHRLLPANAISPCSQLQVITPENIPGASG